MSRYRVIGQRLTHDSRKNTYEMSTILPLQRRLTRQAQECFVNERRPSQGVF
jgi:hypothetical protein